MYIVKVRFFSLEKICYTKNCVLFDLSTEIFVACERAFTYTYCRSH